MPQYDFAPLSSHDFELLVRDLLQEEWKTPVESFTAGRDLGIDLQVGPSDARTIIQCKHFGRSGFRKLLAHIRNIEAPKVAKLAPARYLLATSVGLTPENKTSLAEALAPYVHNSGDILGLHDLNNLLGKHPKVEQANFKLWLTSTPVLQRVLHNAEVSQTEFEVRRVHSKLRLYVQNSTYPRALDLLERGNVVIISGIPGIGKTTLAELLLYAHLEKSYTPVLIRSDIREGRKLFEHSIKQIFYYDDFLGQTFLGEGHNFLSHNQDSDLLDFMEMIRQSNSKLVMTTREHILNNAIQISERFRQSFILENRCVLELSDYSFGERAKVLYNHIYFSDLPLEYRRQLIEDDFFLKILSHRNFSPRQVEWLAAYTRVKNAPTSEYRQFVLGLLENPAEIWRHSFQKQISDACQSLLIALWSLGGEAHYAMLEPAWTALHHTRCQRYGFRSEPDAFRTALKDMEGSFLKTTSTSAGFLNPSVKDFLNSVVGESLDQTSDIVNSLCYVTQLDTLWALRAVPLGQRIRQFLTSDSIVAKTEKLFTNPIAIEVYRDRQRGARGYQHDVLPEARVGLAVDVAIAVDTDASWRMCRTEVQRLADAWTDGDTPDIDKALSALNGFQQVVNIDVSPIGKATGAQLAGVVRLELLRALPRCNLEDFYRVFDLPEHSDHADWSPSERKALQLSFDEYLRDGLREDKTNCSDDGDMEELADMLDEIAKNLGQNVDNQLHSLRESAEDMRLYGRRRSRSQGQPLQRPQTTAEEADLDAAKYMFRKLLD